MGYGLDGLVGETHDANEQMRGGRGAGVGGGIGAKVPTTIMKVGA